MIKPMLCKTGKPFNSKEWIFELKLDGTRTIAYIENKSLKLINRRGKNFTSRYPELKDLPKHVKSNCILDGEIVVFNDKGIPDFYQLATREQTTRKAKIEILSKTMPATFVIFDILKKDGKNLMNLPLMKRKKILRETVKDYEYAFVIDYIEEFGKKFFKEAVKKGFEGVVAKKKNSVYEQGVRSSNWLKIKAKETIDAIVIGYTEGKGKRKNTFGALVLGAYKDNELIHIGRVGTGWKENDLKQIKSLLEKIVTKNCPVKRSFEKWKDYEAKYKVKWVKPKLVAEIEAMEITPKLELRAPSFKRLRFDKPIEECVLSN